LSEVVSQENGGRVTQMQDLKAAGCEVWEGLSDIMLQEGQLTGRQMKAGPGGDNSLFGDGVRSDSRVSDDDTVDADDSAQQKSWLELLESKHSQFEEEKNLLRHGAVG
jgi:hypothetical protein